MSLWKRRALMWGFVGLLLVAMYQKMVALGFSPHAMVLWYGGLAVLAGIGQILLKPKRESCRVDWIRHEHEGAGYKRRDRPIDRKHADRLGNALASKFKMIPDH